MTGFLAQYEPLIDATDADAVSDYMRSGGWLTEFEHTRALEAAVAAAVGAPHCAIAPNGALALFLALRACGIGAGDEVIVPDLTMVASATSVIMAGASVRFVDIERETLCLDLAAAEAAITPATRAIIFVSLNGRAPTGLPGFVARCRERGIRVIEDAAQSMGSSLDGIPLGTIGDLGMYSFASQKIVTMGQGGAVVTADAALHARMTLLRDFGRSSGGQDHYLTVGWNLKFTDLQAVVGLSQLRRLHTLVQRKRDIFAAYREQLSDATQVELLDTDLTNVAPWFVDTLVRDGRRSALIAHLRAAWIGSRPMYPALHSQPAFGLAGEFSVAEEIGTCGLWLPSSLHLTGDDIERVCAAIRAF